jgi:hypothetical protein
MQTAIALVIVVLAAFYLVRRFYNSVQKQRSPACGCGCDGCGPAQEENCSGIDPPSH